MGLMVNNQEVKEIVREIATCPQDGEIINLEEKEEVEDLPDKVDKVEKADRSVVKATYAAKEVTFRVPENGKEAIEYFLEIESAVDNAKNILKEYSNAVSHVVQLYGKDKYFQSKKGDVYKVVTSEGRWIPNIPLEVKTTRSIFDPFRNKRKQRTLSLEAARKAGFEL
tara:strand:+ start:711 stop:1214 length:504 start_codon:yes stop_codon:yes gene_type:complete